MQTYLYHYFAITILAALLLSNGNAALTSGEVEFEQIYNKVTGSERINYSSEKIKLKRKLVETTKNINLLLKQQGKLYRECGEKCTKEINDISIHMDGERNNMTQITTKLVELSRNVNLQNAKEIGIFSAIESACGRNYRDLYYREYYESWSEKQRLRDQGAEIDYLDTYEKSYLKTKEFIDTNVIVVNCEWKLLDGVYESILEMHEKK